MTQFPFAAPETVQYRLRLGFRVLRQAPGGSGKRSLSMARPFGVFVRLA
jgi:hypothetical protein